MSDALTGLEADYQILTELYRSAGSVTYLARNLRLARDVTVTVVPAPSNQPSSLSRLEADVKLLMTLRHPNVVPVLEGRWLGDGSYAVVRARVRGSTLDQLISAVGAVPAARTGTTLETVHAALVWARTSGVTLRHVAPESVVFQQGSGRVLVAFDTPPAALARSRAPAQDGDARMIGRLAHMMLSGRTDESGAAKHLAELRPDIEPRVAAAADDLIVAGDDRDAIRFLSYLLPDAPPAVVSGAEPAIPVADDVPASRKTVPRGAAGAPIATPVRTAPAVAAATTPAVVAPAVTAEIRRPRRFGTGARVATGVVASLLVLGAAALAVLQPRELREFMSRAPTPADTTATATGDVSNLHAKPANQIPGAPMAASVASTDSGRLVPADTSGALPVSSGAASVDSAIAAANSATVSPVTSGSSPAVAGGATLGTSGAGSPATAGSNAGTALNAAGSMNMPNPSNAATASFVLANDAACTSPVPADQRKCFADAVEHSDTDLYRVYGSLIAALRRQANAAANDPDPASVDKLRGAERAWLDERDRACHAVGTGVFSGRDRGQCIADRAEQRARELQHMLDALPGGNR